MDLNTKTKAALNLKITTEIAGLTKRANSQIEGLRLNSAEARKEMRKQLLFAIRSMASEAKKNLAAATKSAEKNFMRVNAAEAAAATMQRSLLALKTETAKKIKKANTRVDAYAAQLKKEAADVKGLMKAQMKLLTGKVSAQKKQAAANIAAADAKSAAGYSAAMSTLEKELEKSEKKAAKRFGTVYEDMAQQRKDLDNQLGAATNGLNDAIAKQAALADSRFSKTVKDIAAARKEAAGQVKSARQEFATGLYSLTSNLKEMETRLVGEVEVVAGEVVSERAAQARVNRHTNAEIKRIQTLMNSRKSSSIKARGKLTKILNENKRAAAEEVSALS